MSAPVRIVFSDVDGTLLSSAGLILPGTLEAVAALKKRGVPFVIVSARSPAEIWPILDHYGLVCPAVAYSGALILDEKRRRLWAKGFGKPLAARVLDYLETAGLDCTWNLFTLDDRWLVRDRRDQRVWEEERIVKVEAEEGTLADLPEDAQLGKILCMCGEAEQAEIERRLRERFPELSITPSHGTLLELMAAGVTKSAALDTLCALWGVDPAETAAFGDQWNDLPMLERAGYPFLMANAPAELKARVGSVTASNDDEGIYKALKNLGIIQEEET